MVAIDPKIFFNSGLESVAVLATQSGSKSIKVHFHKNVPTDVLEQFDISGSQPIVFVKNTDTAEVKLNNSASTITVEGATYRFTHKAPVNNYIDIYELAE